MDGQKFYAKSKRKTTRARDKTRKQEFIEGKTVCSGFPFFGLEDDEFRNEMVNEVAAQEMKMVSKLRAAEKKKKKKKQLRSTNTETRTDFNQQHVSV